VSSERLLTTHRTLQGGPVLRGGTSSPYRALAAAAGEQHTVRDELIPEREPTVQPARRRPLLCFGHSASSSTPSSCGNTRYQDAARDHLRRDGHDVRDDDVRRLSPLGHDHINLLGRYQFSATDPLDGSLRPLRDPATPET
jgi:hypothetical protein